MLQNQQPGCEINQYFGVMADLGGHTISVEALNERRRLAVKLRLAGMTVAETARLTELSPPTVIAAHHAFLAHGWEGVALRRRGRLAGQGRRLSPVQEAEALAILTDQSPPGSGAAEPGAWTVPLAHRWLVEYFGLTLTRRTAQHYLTRWGFLSPSDEGTDPTPNIARLHLHIVRYRNPTSLDEHEGRALIVRMANRPPAWLPCPPERPLIQTLLLALDGALEFKGTRAIQRLTVAGLDPTRTPEFTRWLADHPGFCVDIAPEPATQSQLQWPEDLPGDKLSAPKAPRGGHAPHKTLHAPLRGATYPSPNNPAPRILPPPIWMEKDPEMTDATPLTHLQRLEAESIHIMREVVAEADNPVMLYSIGKDSAVMLHLAVKAFYPATPPFPLLHVDTTWKFRAMYEFRDFMARKLGMDLLVHVNPDGLAKGINPFTHGSAIHTDIMKTEGLKQALDKYGFDAAFGGARRDEEKSRAKERIFSFRTAQHRWDPKNQRPELWRLYNARKHKGESIRVFPLSNWTELDIWQYIYLENIPIVPLYYSAARPVVVRDGTLIMVDDDRMPLKPGEVPMMKKVRFRTLGCYPLTGAVESEADTLPAIIQEMLLTKTSERQGRVIDHDSTASMEKKKQEGYF